MFDFQLAYQVSFFLISTLQNKLISVKFAEIDNIFSNLKVAKLQL